MRFPKPTVQQIYNVSASLNHFALWVDTSVQETRPRQEWEREEAGRYFNVNHSSQRGLFESA